MMGRWIQLVVLAGTLFLVACGQRASPPAPTPTPTPTLTPREYLDLVFPEGPGRQLVLSRCVACHSIDRMVGGQHFDKGGWEYTRYNHEIIVKLGATNTKEELDIIFEYLSSVLGEDRPPLPPIPESLIAGAYY